MPVSSIVTFADIGFDDAELIMRPVNKAHAKRIAKSDGKWPDIECVQIQWKNTEPFLLIDGRHRLEAAKMLGMQNVRITTRLYDHKEDIVENAMMANLHHGLIVQRKKLTDYVIWLYENDYWYDQIAEIVELDEKAVRRTISKYESESEEGDDVAVAKSDGQLLLDYITRFHKRVSGSDTPASIANEIIEAAKSARPEKQKEYATSIGFMSVVLSHISTSKKRG